MRDSFFTGVLRPLALPVVLAAACTRTAPPPITPTQRAQLAEAAASPSDGLDKHATSSLEQQSGHDQ